LLFVVALVLRALALAPLERGADCCFTLVLVLFRFCWA
jgi:hypothetical protein